MWQQDLRKSLIIRLCDIADNVKYYSKLTSKSLQSDILEIATAYEILGNPLLGAIHLKESFDEIMKEAAATNA